MKILVTGGAGFVGSVLIPELLRQGFQVKAYDNLMFGLDGLFGCFGDNNFEFIEGDVRDKELLKSSVEDCDIIIHLAALVGYPLCKKLENEALTINVGGTNNVCSVAEERPILLASTGSCYGNIEKICTEEDPLQPLTIYGESKALAEQAVRNKDRFIIYRFATGFGVSPRMRLDLMVNDFCYKAVKDKNLVVYESNFKRTFIHVKDMAKAYIHAINNVETMNKGVFNVGSEEMNLSKKDIAQSIREKVPYYLHYADFEHDEDKRDYLVSYEKIRNVGYSHEVSLNDGLDQLLEVCSALKIRASYSNV